MTRADFFDYVLSQAHPREPTFDVALRLLVEEALERAGTERGRGLHAARLLGITPRMMVYHQQRLSRLPVRRPSRWTA